VLSDHWTDHPIWIEKTTRMEVQVSAAAREVLAAENMLVGTLLKRHFTGDWGMVDPAVAAKNEGACQSGGLVTSVHRVAGTNVVVKTFPGHNMTYLALEDEAP
jgi:hypothetical protein